MKKFLSILLSAAVLMTAVSMTAFADMEELMEITDFEAEVSEILEVGEITEAAKSGRQSEMAASGTGKFKIANGGYLIITDSASGENKGMITGYAQSGNGDGGAIYNDGFCLLENCTISKCHAANNGGSYSGGSFRMENATITGWYRDAQDGYRVDASGQWVQ